MTLDEQIDEILHKYWEGIAWDIGPEPRNDDPAKQAITQLIADEVKKAIDDYQTNFEQRHIASAVRLARIDELKQLLTDDGQCICQLANQEVCDHNWSLCNTVNDRIAELQSTQPSNKSKE